MPTNTGNIADAFFGKSDGYDLNRYGKALFPDQDETRIGQTVERERAAGKDDHAILGEGVEVAQQRLPREYAGRAQQIQQQYQDEVQKQQALSAERTRAQMKWKLLAGLGSALAGRDPSAIQAHFDQLEQINLQGGLKQAEQTKEAGLGQIALERQGMQDEQQQTLFAQQQEDRQRQMGQRSAEDDPNSTESKLAQQLAEKLTGRPQPGITATQFKSRGPDLEKIYQIEQQRLARQDAANAASSTRAEAQKDRTAAREDSQQFREQQAQVSREDKKQQLLEKTEVPGYGVAHDETEARDLRQLAGGAKYADQLIDELIALRESKGGGEMWDQTAVRKAKQNASELRILVKDAAKLGVLSATDYSLLENLVPEDPLEFNPMATATFQDDPTMNQLKQLKQNFARRIQSGMQARLRSQPGAEGQAGLGQGQAPDEVQTRTLKDGTQVRVRKLPDGSWEEVQ